MRANIVSRGGEAILKSFWSAGILLFLVITSFACGPEKLEATAWCRVDGANPTTVISSGKTTSLQIEEVWRRGGAVGDQILAGAFNPAVDRPGRIAIPDPMLQQVIFIDQNGEWRGPVLTGGEGPGEVMVPVAAQWSNDGSLLTLDVLGPKTVRTDVETRELLADTRGAQHVFVSLSRNGDIGSVAVSDRGEILMEAPLDRIGTDPTTQLSAKMNWYEADKPEAKPIVLMDVATIAVSENQLRIAPGFQRPLAAIGPGNVLALAGDTERYRVRILDSNRVDSVLICRDVPTLPLTQFERGLVDVDGLDEFIADLRIAERSPNPVGIGRIFFGATGRLWVQRDRENPYFIRPVLGGTYDIFSADGEYVGTVNAPENVVLHGESQDLVVGYEYGELDEQSVVAYRIISSGD